MSEKDNEIIQSLIGLGLSEQKAKETIKNAALTKILLTILHEVRGVVLRENAGVLLYHLASKIKPQIHQHIPLIAKYIVSQKLDTTLRVEKAIEYCLAHLNDINTNEFEKYCGVGIVVTPEQIEETIEKLIEEYKNELVQKRYKFNVGPLMQKVRNRLPWADGKIIKNEIDIQILELLGPKTELDLAPQPKTVTIKPPVKSDNKPVQTPQQILTIFDVMKKVSFHAPGDNQKTDGYVVTPNTKRLLEAHLKATGGKVRTRFPPEPNGILHIGHAKAININFGYAAVNNGECYLRYDDTNPEKEEEKFFEGIRDIVTWLGYKPAKITHSSDYFDQLYEWAVKLIQKGLAYVCHQTADEMKGFNAAASPWRDRPVTENQRLFEDMKNGKIDEGAATLRMKITLEEGKLDPVAYRIRFIPHHRTGNKWCIYPTYDYTHCLCDSIENITHSLCTKEFQSRRSSYYWLCNALDIYCPVQWEYGRLNMNYTVVSKRKIAKLIDEGVVKDWDDPRLYTLTALRRRGFPSEAVNNFCAQLGVTGAQSTVDPSMLEAFVRDYLNNVAERRMVVLDPLKITINNFPIDKKTVSVLKYPNKSDSGKYDVNISPIIYIERNDFAELPDKGYKRLTLNQVVGLRYADLILEAKEIEKDDKNRIVNVICDCIQVEKSTLKPKAFIHWVSNPIEIEVRLYSSLFKHKNPEDSNEVPGGFLSDCDLDSLKIIRSFADVSLKSVKVHQTFQFERNGYFTVDQDTTDNQIVFNQTVNLKEDAGK